MGIQDRGRCGRIRAERTNRDTRRGACFARARNEFGKDSIGVSGVIWCVAADWWGSGSGEVGPRRRTGTARTIGWLSP